MRKSHRHHTEDAEPFEIGDVRFYLRRHNLTGQHRAAWKQASTLQRAMEERTGQTLARVAQLDGLLASGALKSQSYEAARNRIDDTTLARLGQMEGALNILLDLHLVHWENPSSPSEPMPTCDAKARRALPPLCKLDLADEVRRRLILDFGPERAARNFGLWGTDVEEARRI